MSMAINNQPIELIEKGVLAAVLDDSEVAGVVAEILNPIDFSEPRHEIVFRKALDFYRDGKAFDILHFVNSIAEDGNLNSIGGYEFFMELMDVEAVYANADPVVYAEIVRENSQRRALNLVGTKISENSMTGSGYKADDLVAYMQSSVSKFAENSFSTGPAKIADMMDQTFADLEDLVLNGIAHQSVTPTGFIDLDVRISGGFRPGNMAIIAARPGFGKTTLALDIARNAAFMAEKSVVFFSLEMGAKELVLKLLAAEAHVHHAKLMSGEGLTEDDWARLQRARAKLAASDLRVDDSPKLDLVSLRAKCLKQKMRPEGLDLVFIDYLQLMEAPPGHQSREQQVSEISRTIKLLAKELECPIVVLAQLNRGNVNRTDKTPMASDLRESGSLEQDADLVLLLHSREAYDPNDKPGITEIIVGKARAGKTGVVDVMSLLEYAKFGNATGKYQAEQGEIPNDDDPPPPPEEDVFAEDFPNDNLAIVELENNSQDSPNLSISALEETREIEIGDPDSGGAAWA